MVNRKILQVSEIFFSIQGESSFAGLPCVFIRLAGCDIGCRWCDTKYAASGGKAMIIDDIMRQVGSFACKHVELTGGEPLMQNNTPLLAERLIGAGFTVLCETSGVYPIEVLPSGVVRIMDVKCPSSGVVERMRWENIEHLEPADEVKFVLADRADYDFARNVVKEHDLANRVRITWFGPVFDVLSNERLAGWILSDRLGVRLHLQQHKYIWPPGMRGV